MYFALNPEQRRLQESLRVFAATHSSESTVRALMATDTGYDADSWKLLADDLGVVALGADLNDGGRGGSLVDVTAALEVLGEYLYCGPYLSSVFASYVIAAGDPHDPVRQLMEPLASGSRIVCALWPHGSDHVTASEGPYGSVLNGVLAAALDGGLGEDLLVATNEHGDWYQVRSDAPSLTRTALPALDQTRGLAELRFSDTPARRIDIRPDTTELLARLGILEQIAVAADQLGVARRSFNAAVEYAKQRTQFGRAIGTFQAIQHPLADIALAVECAWSATYQAAWDFDHQPERVERSAALAAAVSGDAALRAADAGVQIHAGVGFTWDNPAHLYLKRAKSSRLLWGHPDEHRRRLAELLGI
jgi:alkylation response protein AidB-like acyl-CoA dehydrogenase